ncbi:MAG: DUF2905 domain-containing protein [Pseudomonadota bacterium]|nr:DUF2905 domain-containing protein [Pseudomonadota bacterium]
MQKTLILIGVVLVLVGLAWPAIRRSGLGRLPGDFVFSGEHFSFYFPLTTSILVSLALTLLFWLFNR